MPYIVNGLILKWILHYKYNKPIIGIKPRGNVNTPMFISNNAYMVNWNSQSLFDAIRRYF